MKYCVVTGLDSSGGSGCGNRRESLFGNNKSLDKDFFSNVLPLSFFFCYRLTLEIFCIL